MNLSKLKVVFSLITLASSLFFFNSCNKEEKEDAPAPVPEITSFTPDSGQEGDTITIAGENFSAKSAENIVKFNETPASVIDAATTKLTVTVPEGAASGKLTVSVGEQTTASADDFTVIQILEVSSFSPENGVAGDTVTITGKNFSTELAKNKVKFGTITATVASATATKLTVIVPDKAATGKINISVNNQTVISKNTFTVINSIAIHDFSPVSGVAGDTVTITGENFSPELTGNAVKIGEITAEVIEADTAHLKITVPQGAETGSINVTVNGKTATTGEDVFTVIYPPVITSFAPESGPVGTTITITGTNFSTVLEENVVKIGDATATVTAATTTQLTVTIPEGATTGPVNVTVNGLAATSSENSFTVIDIPTITGFSPSEGEVGATVIITGENFSTTASENTVKINGTTAEVTAATATQLTVTVPEGATTGAISVTVDGQTANTGTNSFTVIYPPVITNFSPKEGLEWSYFNIYGQNFSLVASENVVKIGGTTATVTSATGNILAVRVPGGATTGVVELTVNGHEATPLADVFKVIVPPAISGFSPSSAKAGEVVTITGTNFSETIAENTVKFNGVTATVNSASTTSLEVIVPAGIGTAPGKITVTIDGQTATSADDFTLTPVKVVKVAAGGFHTMFLKDDNTLWATGNNYYGQFGNGAPQSEITTTPIYVMEGIKDVSASANYTLILKNDNTLWACGANAYGELGTGTPSDQSAPQQIMSDVKAFEAGPANALILTNANELWICGRNTYGQVGNGETGGPVLSPVLIMTDVKTMTAGNFHTLIVNTNNELWATGRNDYGQLGDGTLVDKNEPVKVETDVKAAAAGIYHSIAIKSNNTLWASGHNLYGQLGNGGSTLDYEKEFILVIGNVAKVAAGQYHTILLTADNSVLTTGRNHHGQLAGGFSNTYIRKNFDVLAIDDVVDIFTGNHNTFFIKSNNTVWGAGENGNAQLGLGVFGNVTRPAAIGF